MGALDRLEPAAAAAAMQSIHRVVLNAWFLGACFGAAVLGVGVAVLALVAAAPPASLAIAAGGGSGVVGTFGVTVARNVPRNVPRNEALDRFDPARERAADAWRLYGDRWTRWNHVRTAAGLLGAALRTVGALALRAAYRTSASVTARPSRAATSAASSTRCVS